MGSEAKGPKKAAGVGNSGQKCREHGVGEVGSSWEAIKSNYLELVLYCRFFAYQSQVGLGAPGEE